MFFSDFVHKANAQRHRTDNIVKHLKNTIVNAFFEDTVTYKRPKLIVLDYSVLDGTRNIPSYIAELNNGRCRFDLELSHPVFVQFKGVVLNIIAFKSFSTDLFTDGIFLEPGDSISIEVRKPDLSSGSFLPILHYSGRGAAKMVCQQEIFEKTNLYPRPNAPENLRRFSLTDSVIDMIVSTIDKYMLSRRARSILRANLITMLTPDVSEVIVGNSDVPSMDIYSSEVKEIYANRLNKNMKFVDLFDPDLRFSRIDFYGRDFLRRRALLQYAMYNNTVYTQEFNKMSYRALLKYIPECPLKERALAHYVEKCIEMAIHNPQPEMGSDLKELANDFLSRGNRSDVYHKNIRENIKNLEQGLVKGAPAYSFALPDTNGEIIKLEDFKGKVVLIDFMFNNCLPCRQMIPFLKNIGRKFEGKGLIILSVCADKEREQWMQAISHANGLNAIYTFTEGKGFDHPLIRHYEIHSYPTLVLIDQQGKLVTPRAPDPREDDGLALDRLIGVTLAAPNNN